MPITRIKSTSLKHRDETSKSIQPVLLVVSIIGFAILSGCISQQPEVLNVNPEIYWGQVEYSNLSKAVGMFAVIKGSIPQVKESYEEIIVNKTVQQSTFSVDDDLNFVISRGITPGFDINISRVEKQGDVYTVYATYIDQGTDLGILSHPVAIIPIGKLAAGDYEARLRVTRVLNTLEGRKVIELEKELNVFNFKVKPPEDEKVVLKVNPEIYGGPMVGVNGSQALGMFTVIKGNISEVKDSFENIVTKRAAQQSTFSVDDNLNFVISRGITRGLDMSVDKVEKQENVFTVHATYVDTISDLGIVSHPVAIIPIGKLAAGEYKAKLKVTKVSDYANGTKIIRKVIETEKELSIINFEVKPTASNIGISSENVSSGYLQGQVFDELSGNFTKNWDAENFAGFWRDPETNVSTETLVIDQRILNNSHRVIEKHNLIYTTKSMPVKFQVYMHANQTPAGTDGFYPVVGWMGDKYVFLEGNKLAKIIFEQNVTNVKSIRVGESWNLEGGYRIVANSIDADGIMQAWISLVKDNTKIDDKVLATRYTELYSYPQNVERGNIPILVIYLSKIYSLPETDAADFRYTWLRSQKFTGVKEGDVFGVMEVTSVENDSIELRNKEPIELTSGGTIHLMGNIGIQVGSSKTCLLFYPVKGGI
ncbi:MAG: S-layer protein domain-containing protein [Candidatus Methanoperedens sp.]|nr:S-layer protein domain-containing protein [Candidatus Methanoperedens sp.]MCZ7403371.1 S-layer protein domain-containing protein [Candidatus Methanoperedens sp.]